MTTIMLLDRCAGLFALLCWPLVAASFFPALVSSQPILRTLLWAAAAAVALLTGVFVVASLDRVRTSTGLQELSRRLPFGWVVEKAMSTVGALRRHPVVLLRAIAMSVVAHTLAIGATLLVAAGMNPDGFAWSMGLLMPLGFLANALPLSPGGLGVGETAADQLFALVGLVGGAEVFLGWRSLMLTLGLIGLVLYLKGRKDFVDESAPSMSSSLQGAVLGAEGPSS